MRFGRRDPWSARDVRVDEDGLEGAGRPTRSAVPPPELCGAVALILLIVTGLSVSTRSGSGNGPGQDELIIHTGRIEGVAFTPDGL